MNPFSRWITICAGKDIITKYFPGCPWKAGNVNLSGLVFAFLLSEMPNIHIIFTDTSYIAHPSHKQLLQSELWEFNSNGQWEMFHNEDMIGDIFLKETWVYFYQTNRYHSFLLVYSWHEGQLTRNFNRLSIYSTNLVYLV